MYCYHCGSKVPAGSLFCNRCGAKINTEDIDPQSRQVRAPVVRPARRKIAVEDQFTGTIPNEDYDYEDDDELVDYEDPIREHKSVLEVDEDTIFTIYPAFYEVGNQYLIAILASLAATALIAYLNIPFWIAVIFAVICLIRPIYHHIQNKHTVYRLTSTKIEIKSGIFSIKSRNIPLRHIQDVSVSATFKERLIGIGDVVIDSAAVEGKIFMRNIKNPQKYADMILEQL